MKKECPSRTPGTIEHFKTARWNDLKKRVTLNGKPSKLKWYSGKNLPLKMTKKQFYNWCSKQWPNIQRIQNDGEIASIDRINPKLGYSIRNIRVLSRRENSALGQQKTKPILGYSPNLHCILLMSGCWTGPLADLGFDPSSVQKICKRKKGKGTRAVGFYWRYADKHEIRLLNKNRLVVFILPCGSPNLQRNDHQS